MFSTYTHYEVLKHPFNQTNPKALGLETVGYIPRFRLDQNKKHGGFLERSSTGCKYLYNV